MYQVHQIYFCFVVACYRCSKYFLCWVLTCNKLFPYFFILLFLVTNTHNIRCFLVAHVNRIQCIFVHLLYVTREYTFLFLHVTSVSTLFWSWTRHVHPMYFYFVAVPRASKIFLSHTCIIHVSSMFKLNRRDYMICTVYAFFPTVGESLPNDKQTHIWKQPALVQPHQVQIMRFMPTCQLLHSTCQYA
jgi:hypothetical protein